MLKMPAGLEYWTADSVSECLDIDLPRVEAFSLSKKLWNFVTSADNPTPLGGDGSGGTVEHPDGRMGLDNDDKGGHWWPLLTDKERAAIAAAWEKEF